MARRSRMSDQRENLRPPRTQADIARIVGCKVRTVQRWEAGTHDPYDRQLAGIAKAYDWPLDDIETLLLRDGERPPESTYSVSDVERRTFLAGSVAFVATGAMPVPPEFVGYLADQLAGHWQADRMLGPHLLIDHVEKQCRTVTRAVDSTTGTLHNELLHLATAYTGLVGWLYQDMGDLDACDLWLGKTLELGHRSRDARLVAYALTCKAMVRVDASDGIGAVDFAEAALGTSKDIGAKARAMALQHAAHGYALLGDREAVERLLDQLGQLLEALASDRHPWGGDRLRHNSRHALNVHRATCYERLGLADESASLWAEVVQQPPHERRDRGVHLARQAMALADVGDPAGAAKAAAEGAGYLAATGSVRMRQEFTRLRQKASPWRGTPAGRDLVEVLDAIA